MYTLVGVNGNAFSVMGYVMRAMKERRRTREEIDVYVKDAMSSDYDHLLVVSNDMIEELNDGLYDEMGEEEMYDEMMEELSDED